MSTKYCRIYIMRNFSPKAGKLKRWKILVRVADGKFWHRLPPCLLLTGRARLLLFFRFFGFFGRGENATGNVITFDNIGLIKDNDFTLVFLLDKCGGLFCVHAEKLAGMNNTLAALVDSIADSGHLYANSDNARVFKFFFPSFCKFLGVFLCCGQYWAAAPLLISEFVNTL